MWVVGLLLGLTAGVLLTGSVPVALGLALVGAVALPALTKKKAAKAPPTPEPTPDAAGVVATKPAAGAGDAAADPVQALQLRVVALEQRVRQLEQHLATGVPTPAAATVQAVQLKPAPLPSLAPFAVPAPQPAALAQGPVAAAAAAVAVPALAVPPRAVTPAIPADSPAAEPGRGTVPAQPSVPPTVPPAAKVPPVAKISLSPSPAAPAAPAVPLRERLPAPVARLIFGGNVLVKLGVLILFLGLAFLLRYTAERVTVPVELRYAGVALAGAALLGLGWFLRGRRRDYALVLQGAGVAVFYLGFGEQWNREVS
ncbi:MAG: hypothetical protein GAK30_03656 [Paracidovorax wautersii]|uniref:DUF2339 domain-containing protein n=1 Tax=Paracidovorax wautersii TaxID=1177982 RepID=A0A7V8FKL1_9BURK|nr:MAG: hypothetical protein GAK30_03656 [Paracidovorax wautersii]